jgi:excisionase family DNA binding protein
MGYRRTGRFIKELFDDVILNGIRSGGTMFLTVKQAAELLGLELHHVYYLLVMGNIEGVKIAKSWRLAVHAVRAYKESLAAL